MTAMAVLSLVVGLTACLKIQLLGELYVAELLLPVAALIAVTRPRRENYLSTGFFRFLAIASVLVVVGYVFSDIVRGTAPNDAWRGFGRGLILVSNFVSLAIITAQDRRNFWWFVVGFGLGGLLYLRFIVDLSFTIWKHGMGQSRGYSLYVVPLCAALAWLVPLRVAALGFVALAGYSAHFDFRTFSVLCVAIAGMLWLRGGDTPGQVRKVRPGLVVAAAVVGALVAGAVSYALSYRNDEVSSRRAYSNEMRWYGSVLGVTAIQLSPVIGWGSWNDGPEFQEVQRVANQTFDLTEHTEQYAAATYLIHSQLLQAWAEGGFLAAIFFLTLFIEGLRRMTFAVLARPIDPLTPILLYFVVLGLFNLIGAPFSATMRLDIAFMALALAVLAGDAAAARAAAAPRRARA